MKNEITRPFFILLFIGLTNILFAQNRLDGIITDAQTEEALIGANIFLASDFSIGSQTNLDGQFSIKTAVKSGTLVVSYIGYEDQMVVFQNDGKTIPIKMIPKATLIETVVVKGDKLTGQVFAVEKIGKLDIYLNPSSQADALKAVQSNPAATTVDETANVSLRGSPASETGVFLNNVPLNDVVRLDQSNGVGQSLESGTKTDQETPAVFGIGRTDICPGGLDPGISKDAFPLFHQCGRY